MSSSGTQYTFYAEMVGEVQLAQPLGGGEESVRRAVPKATDCMVDWMACKNCCAEDRATVAGVSKEISLSAVECD
jgi:hypothetical protein